MASQLETTRIDVASSTVTYIGKASIGSSESAAVWKIQKLVSDVNGGLSILFVDGRSDSDSVWADRASYTYS
jgi:hypothetical protein